MLWQAVTTNGSELFVPQDVLAVKMKLVSTTDEDGRHRVDLILVLTDGWKELSQRLLARPLTRGEREEMWRFLAFLFARALVWWEGDCPDLIDA